MKKLMKGNEAIAEAATDTVFSSGSSVALTLETNVAAEAPNSHAHIRRRMYCPGFNGENLFVFALRSAKSVYFLEQIYYFLILHHLYLFVNSGYIFRHVFRRCRDRICSGEGLDCLC